MTDPVIIGGLLALGASVSELVKAIVSKFVTRKPNSMARQVAEVAEIVTFKDANGAPRVYWPREIVETQKQIAEHLARAASAAERTVEICERMEHRMERHQEQIEDAVVEVIRRRHASVNGTDG